LEWEFILAKADARRGKRASRVAIAHGIGFSHENRNGLHVSQIGIDNAKS
jgi:hypothetical protein